MTSDLKSQANRANSGASTGPRTPQGRARAARNALRHGLSLPVCSDPVLSDHVEALAREIAGGDTNPEIQHSARLIAEAQIDLLQIRQARHQLLTDALHDLMTTTPGQACVQKLDLRKLDYWLVSCGLMPQRGPWQP